ncbi:hypothetical protein [Actibacterium lipolyticum]|uniref:Uncharacterized protein n=1 Tax=Actibacterium lipolyticum TaxID=1524263 RepID=A0A238JTF0_9RHOB|nr:hypothetical protein [Actibacterium lipolyticum]SMX33026.1 hypothetical protein COL8621_00941 [Actibacterium lipolyticum]
MYALDSRVLGPLNCYMQKVTEPGEFVFEIRMSAGGFLPMADASANRIKVKANKANAAKLRSSGKQHMVPLKHADGGFQVGDMPKEVEQGDAILFHQPDRNAPAFSVAGRVGKTTFSSTELRDQVVYTHAFGLPGRYEWVDANGSGVGGVIIVENEPAEGKDGAERAMKRMGEGVLVHIVGNKVKPKEVRIATGQTVFFAVEDADGITITDKTLLRRGKADK